PPWWPPLMRWGRGETAPRPPHSSQLRPRHERALAGAGTAMKKAPGGGRGLRGSATRRLGTPIGRRAVVVVDLAAPFAIRPVPGLVLGIFRRTLELLLADIDLVAAELRIVGEQRPGQRVIVLADAHEAAEAHHRIGDLAAELVDHDPLDLAGALAVRAIDGGSFHLVAADETSGFAALEGRPLRHVDPPLCWYKRLAQPTAANRAGSATATISELGLVRCIELTQVTRIEESHDGSRRQVELHRQAEAQGRTHRRGLRDARRAAPGSRTAGLGDRQ